MFIAFPVIFLYICVKCIKMGQPIRKQIKEAHPESTREPFYTLLVDGTNLLRIAFADTKINTKGQHYGAVYQFLYQLRKMMEKL